MEYFIRAFKNIFNFSDRANRAEFWAITLPLWFAAFILWLIYFLTFTNLPAFFNLFQPILVFLQLYIFMQMGVLVRRLHDVDLNPWLSLLSLIPWIGWIFSVVAGCLPGKPYPNQWGEKAFVPEPKAPSYGPGYGGQSPYGGPPPYMGPQQPQYGPPQPPQFGPPQPPQFGQPQPPQFGGPQGSQYGTPPPPPQGSGPRPPQQGNQQPPQYSPPPPPLQGNGPRPPQQGNQQQPQFGGAPQNPNMRPPQAPQPNGRPAGDPPSFTKKD